MTADNGRVDLDLMRIKFFALTEFRKQLPESVRAEINQIIERINSLADQY